MYEHIPMIGQTHSEMFYFLSLNMSIPSGWIYTNHICLETWSSVEKIRKCQTLIMNLTTFIVIESMRLFILLQLSKCPNSFRRHFTDGDIKLGNFFITLRY